MVLSEYRYMDKEDLGVILQIERSSNPFPWTLKNFTDCIEKEYYCLVQEHEKKVSGFAILSIALDETHLLNIGIVESMRRRGFGKEVLNQAIHASKEMGSRKMLLEVRPSNFAAINLYLNEGFKKLSIRKDYYKTHEGREDALVMVKTLGRSWKEIIFGE